MTTAEHAAQLAAVRLCACGCGEATRPAKQTDARKGWVKGQPVKYRYGHRGLNPHTSYVVCADGCWEWTERHHRDGYGRLVRNGRTYGAHQWFYEHYIGPVPNGLELDHLCRNRVCVNPTHLEAVTHRVNSLRGAAPAARNAHKTHCPKGHPYDEANTLVSVGGRYCRACRRQRIPADSERRRQREAERASS